MTFKPWPTADQQQQEQGRTDVVGAFLIDPTTGQPYSASGGSGGAVTVADGANVAQGSTTDTALTTAASNGTGMAFLKGFVKILADAWDSTNHWLQVKVMNTNANGQATMVNSSPVAIASDQSKLPTKAASGDFVAGSIVDLATLAAAIASNRMQTQRSPMVLVYSTTQTGISATADSGDLDFSKFDQVLILANLTAFTGTSIQFRFQAKDNFSAYYNAYAPTALTAAGSIIGSLGGGMGQAIVIPSTAKIQWLCTAVTSATFTISVYAR